MYCGLKGINNQYDRGDSFLSNKLDQMKTPLKNWFVYVDMMGRNRGGLFVEVGCRQFPAHHYRQFAPEVCCRKFLA